MVKHLKAPAYSLLEILAILTKNHPSIIKIKQVANGSDNSDSERFSLKTVNETEIKKTSGIDAIPPKLIKLSAKFLTALLMKAINTSITQNAFSRKR